MSGVISRFRRFHEELMIQGNNLCGLSTGLYDLDQMTHGFRAGELVVLAGRPAMGKSCLAQNIAIHTAVKLELPVIYCTLDVNSYDLASRMVRSLADLGNHNWYLYKNVEDRQRFESATEILARSPLYVLDNGRIDIKQLCTEIREHVQRTGAPKLIVVDSLSQISAGPRTDPYGDKDTLMILRELKLLAKDLETPLVLTCTLDRRLEERENRRPQLIDLDYAAELEADMVLAIYREEYYTKELCEVPGVTEIHILKNPHGPIGVAILRFLRSVLRFETIA